MSIKKLVRNGIIVHLKEDEYERIEDSKQLNELYALKIREELAEVVSSECADIMEFADLATAVFCFAAQNGFSKEQLNAAMSEKADAKGVFTNIALTNLNPNNSSNNLYFDLQAKKSSKQPKLLRLLGWSNRETTKDLLSDEDYANDVSTITSKFPVVVAWDGVDVDMYGLPIVGESSTGRWSLSYFIYQEL